MEDAVGACSVQRWLDATGGSHVGASALRRSLQQPLDNLCLPCAGIPEDNPGLPPHDIGWRGTPCSYLCFAGGETEAAPARPQKCIAKHWFSGRLCQTNPTSPRGCSAPLQDELSAQRLPRMPSPAACCKCCRHLPPSPARFQGSGILFVCLSASWGFIFAS